MSDGKREAAEGILNAFLSQPDLAFQLGQFINQVAGPWEERKDSRSMTEWVRKDSKGSTIAQVWLDSNQSMAGHWRGAALNQKHLIDKNADAVKARVDEILSRAGWVLVE